MLKVAPTPITISGKTGMPKDVFGKGLTASALKQLQLELCNGIHDEQTEPETATLASRVSQLSIRPKHETLEEKKYVLMYSCFLVPFPTKTLCSLNALS